MSHLFEYTEVRPSNWKEILDFIGSLNSNDWLFRGHSDAEWKLQSTLERISQAGNRSFDEVTIYKQFQRRAHHYLQGNQLPRKSDWLEWWALMQHFSAPTRLLDWTRSPFVGLFFACECNAIPPKKERCLWCLDATELRMVTALRLDIPDGLGLGLPFVTSATFRKLVMKEAHRASGAAILAVEPDRMNERLTVQQGSFACVTDVKFDFEQVLASYPTSSRSLTYKLQLAEDLRIEILKQLVQMNINAAALFPGLDGFGRSLMQPSILVRQLWGFASTEDRIM